MYEVSKTLVEKIGTKINAFNFDLISGSLDTSRKIGHRGIVGPISQYHIKKLQVDRFYINRVDARIAKEVNRRMNGRTCRSLS